jgi:hypothetical protein
MQAYFRDGEKRALALGNRGPIRLGSDGKLLPEIVASYRQHGFYVFEGVLSPKELAEVRAAAHEVMDHLPSEPDSPVDRMGRPAIGINCTTTVINWTKPLGDSMGGTDLVGGRAPVKMIEPDAPKEAPKKVPLAIMGPAQFDEALLRVYGHPGLLAAAATIHGDDFAPFSDTLIFKWPGMGGSFAWHQDGITHWNSPNWDRDIHGYNCMVQLYDCTAANAVWFVPGSHAAGRQDIKKLVAEAGSNRLTHAVPLICKAGDAAISNRQIVHGSFPNTSKDWRLTLSYGFHRRSSVVGVKTKGVFNNDVTYDAETVRKRSEPIGYAIAARRVHFPSEKQFDYRPQVEGGERFQWDETALGKIQDYQVNDLFI